MLHQCSLNPYKSKPSAPMEFIKYRILTSALMMILFSGCDINSFTKRNESKCIDSERLNFKDPDSVVFIKNLGNRKNQSIEEGKFWIRYKAKNSYGAFIQENMACRKNANGEWGRDHISEQNAVTEAELSILESRLKIPREFRRKNPLSRSEVKDRARDLVYTSPNNIPAPINLDGNKIEIRAKELAKEFGQGFLDIPFGMTENAIRLKLGNELKHLPSPEIYLDAYVNDIIPEYKINEVPVKVSFQIDDETHLLQQILLSSILSKNQEKKSPDELNSISNFLTERYGNPTRAASATASSAYSKIWVRGKTSIELSQSKPSYPITVRYFMTE